MHGLVSVTGSRRLNCYNGGAFLKKCLADGFICAYTKEEQTLGGKALCRIY